MSEHSVLPSRDDESTSPWPSDWLRPSWGGAVTSVKAVMTTRCAPGSEAAHASRAQSSAPPPSPYGDFNLGDHVGDAPEAVAAHRLALADALQARPVWLQQVHGARVVRLSSGPQGALMVDGQPWTGDPIEADGSWTSEPGLVCTVMVADCLPVLLATPEGRGVAALHAGWRGLCGAGPSMLGRGVIEEGVAALCQGTGSEPADLQAWLGACIGPQAFEVGADVLLGCGADPLLGHPCFTPVAGVVGKWWADLPGLARDRLLGLGLRRERITGGQWCTVQAPSRFFSFRRERITGRQAACIWLDR